MKPIWALLACLVLYVPGFVAVTQPEPQKGQSVDRNQIPNWPYDPDGSRVYSDSGPVRLCMLDGEYVTCNKVPLPWKGYVAKANDKIRWYTKTLSCLIEPDNGGASEEICDTKVFDDTDPEMFKTYGEPPFDVPPVAKYADGNVDSSRCFPIGGDMMQCPKVKPVVIGETCADKTRFLLHSEDGKGHCLSLGK